MTHEETHAGIAIGVPRNSPPPEDVRRLFQVRLHEITTPELDALPRPALVVGSMPCERLASAVAAADDLAYVLVGGAGGDAPQHEGWVDGVVPEPRHHHDICDLGTHILERKQVQHVPHPIVSDTAFAWRGQVAELSELEARLVRRMVLARGAVVEKQALAYELWGNYFCDPGRAVDTHIYRIRKRLANISGVTIVTQRQRGFRMIIE
ncbi:MAG: helix-turn-helix domain-containing protein [Dehalococcoidia bacterium]|nr:helix-turn-helix domain-containing protein [Dehalococcoidia bacterium]